MGRTIIILICLTVGCVFFTHGQQRLLGHSQNNWQYIYPFADKNYVLAIQYNSDAPLHEDNTTIYFCKKNGSIDVVYWKERLFTTKIANNYEYVDYNNDGIKDVVLFTGTGGRGGNSYYLLYLVDPKKHTLTKVKGFDNIANPSYDQKHKVIVGYGLSGENYYSLYRFDQTNKIYQIGKAFKDTDKLDLDTKIKEILKKHQ